MRLYIEPEGRWWIDVLLVWVVLFGVWPLADPGHSFSSVGSVLDVVLHHAAGVALAWRWRIVRAGRRLR